MTNPMKGEAVLGELTLAFNFGIFCELEEKTGRKTQELLQAMADGLSFSDLRDFTWAGLQTHHRGITEPDVVALLNEHGYEMGGTAVAKAVTAFFGETKAKGKNPPKAKQAGTG